jgi:hypothetical protein
MLYINELFQTKKIVGCQLTFACLRKRNEYKLTASFKRKFSLWQWTAICQRKFAGGQFAAPCQRKIIVFQWNCCKPMKDC